MRRGRLDLVTITVLAALVIATAALRWRLLDIPLERDEGEYAYAGQLILQGLAPYAHLYHMKLPGTYAAYALILATLGQTARAIHLGLLLVNVATALLVFALARRLFDRRAGLVAAAAFAVLSLLPAVDGVFANAEHFAILPAIAGFLLLLRGLDRGGSPPEIAGAGLLLGLAVLMKQHAAAFAAGGGALLLLWGFGVGRIASSRESSVPARTGARLTSLLAVFALAGSLPYLATVASFWWMGALDSFWFWTVRYARAYTGQVGLESARAALLQTGGEIFRSAPLPYLLAALGLTAIAWSPAVRRRAVFLVVLCLAAALAVVPGFYFRSHYFLFLLPAAALLIAAADVALRSALRRAHRPEDRGRSRSFAARAIPITLLAVVLVQPLIAQRSFLLRLTPAQASRAVFGTNPFVESPAIARFIRNHSSPSDRIVVLGSEPQIYFYAQRRAATGFIYAYPLMEDHPYASDMQRAMAHEIEETKPRFVVLVDVPTSWLARPESDDFILRWTEGFLRNYERRALVEVLPRGPRMHTATDPSQLPQPRPDAPTVEIYERIG